MNSWTSYPKVYNLGHAALKELLEDDVIVEEKVDGSQFSFGLFGGELYCRSRGKELIVSAPEKMFTKAVEVVKKLKPLLKEGWTYRGEYLSKPKHNTLVYGRYPTNHIIIFDINTGFEEYLPYTEKKAEAERLDLEVVPLLYEGKITKIEEVEKLLELESVLGGPKIEGFVVKNYQRFGRDKKVLLGKYVSEAFKESHSKNWKNSNPTGKDFIGRLGDEYKADARWEKAIQHLKERDELTNSPKDIGALLKEIQADVKIECEEEIKEKVWKWAWPHIQRSIIRGFPEWYKKRLLNSQFKD